ncbi:MAG: DsbA family protein [Acidobacteriota bacterium]|nr:DsbA family protein [Acidobacteriota bacterium]
MRLFLALAGLTLWAGTAAVRTELVEGNPVSPVRVVIYTDLQESDCLRLRSILDDKLLPKYGKRVAFVHRDFPLSRHDWARQAAIAARWVVGQDPYLALVFRREILSEQQHLTAATLRPWLTEFAVRNKLDPQGIVAALSDRRLGSLVDQEYQGALARGVTTAPTIIIGNQKFTDTILYEDIARALDIELGR